MTQQQTFSFSMAARKLLKSRNIDIDKIILWASDIGAEHSTSRSITEAGIDIRHNYVPWGYVGYPPGYLQWTIVLGDFRVVHGPSLEGLLMTYVFSRDSLEEKTRELGQSCIHLAPGGYSKIGS